MSTWDVEDLLEQAVQYAEADPSLFGSALRQFRERRGMSASEVATYLQVGPATYRWLCLCHWPRDDAQLRQLCESCYAPYEKLAEVLQQEQFERPFGVH